eukprot:5227437-Amphidinium_carterae.1
MGEASGIDRFLCQSLLDCSRARLELYVDDPVLACRGTQLEIKLNFVIFLTSLRSLGFDLAFHKGQMGSAVIWIGACITTRWDEIIVGVKQQMLVDISRLLTEAEQSNTYAIKGLRALAGKCLHVSSLVPTLKLFLSSLCAALSST